MPIKKNTLVSGTKKVTAKIVKKAQEAVTANLILGMDQAQLYTPLQFGLLRNSAFRTAPTLKVTRVSAKTGFTAGYAVALHENTDWKPRAVGQRGKKRGGANMRAKPKFLKLGFDETRQARKAVVKKIMAI